jgi:hypothetical protein
MAFRLTVYIIDPGDKRIHVEHVFYGKNRAEAEKMKEHHLQACTYFRSAESNGYTDERGEDIDESEWPVAEETGGDIIDV